jgi:hypothetical protein
MVCFTSFTFSLQVFVVPGGTSTQCNGAGGYHTADQAMKLSALGTASGLPAGLQEGVRPGDVKIATACNTIVTPLKFSHRLPLEIASISGAGLGIGKHKISWVID